MLAASTRRGRQSDGVAGTGIVSCDKMRTMDAAPVSFMVKARGGSIPFVIQKSSSPGVNTNSIDIGFGASEHDVKPTSSPTVPAPAEWEVSMGGNFHTISSSSEEWQESVGGHGWKVRASPVKCSFGTVYLVDVEKLRGVKQGLKVAEASKNSA